LLIASVPGWTVYREAGASIPASSSALANPGFEVGPAASADGWSPFGDGYSIDGGGGRMGTRALQLTASAATPTRGATATVTLHQAVPRALYFGAWSRAQAVSGVADLDYSVYLDIAYADGSWLWGVSVQFDVATHDWQYRDRLLTVDKAIDHVNVYCLLRNGHSGTAWFDDVLVREAPDGLASFDGHVVASAPAPPPAAQAVPVRSGDGLGVRLGDGGRVTGVSLREVEVAGGASAASSGGGFFLHDVRRDSDWVHPGGALTANGGVVAQDADVPALGLRFHADYTARADRVDVHAEVSTQTAEERALTLYFALPLAGDWTFGDDLRASRPLAGTDELANLVSESEIGAVGAVSRYPFGVLSGAVGGVVIGYGLSQPRVARIVANPATRQFYVAFDIGLSHATARFAGRAWVDFVLYPIDGAWGFRAAAQGYYDRFAEAFSRRIPAARQGIWVPFTKLAAIPKLADFGVAVHELAALDDVPGDHALGVYSFRYLSEPWSYWMGIDSAGIDPRDPAAYDQVIGILRGKLNNAIAGDGPRAQAALSSGFFDAAGKYVYRGFGPGEVPWCPGASGCALFLLNGDPAISDPQYPINKANLDWSADAQATYATTPALDGEYIDSVQSTFARFQLDQRPSHLATAGQPLTFGGPQHDLGIPALFATVELLHWLAPQLHAKGKLLMGNTMLEDLPWGADIFDFMGVEIDWLSDGQLVPEDDQRLNYRRTLSGQRPYGFLMNTDFKAIAVNGGVERYFQTALFYGIYPSFFSPNAVDSPYWENPSYYERDRSLFAKYVPLIRSINEAGWQPMTRAHSSDAAIYLERYGQWPQLYFAVRNTHPAPAAVTLALDDELGLPAQSLALRTLVAPTPPATLPAGTRTLTVTLQVQAVELLQLSPAN
jgi:hypothetical protein